MSLHFYLTAALLFVSGAFLLTAAAAELMLNVLLTTGVLVATLTVLTVRLAVWDEPNRELTARDGEFTADNYGQRQQCLDVLFMFRISLRRSWRHDGMGQRRYGTMQIQRCSTWNGLVPTVTLAVGVVLSLVLVCTD